MDATADQASSGGASSSDSTKFGDQRPPRITERFPLWLRTAHWLNSIFLTGMIWSGLLIYWANGVYSPFFPDWFYDALGLKFRLSEGLAWHFALAWLFSVNGSVYVSGLLLTGEWRTLAPKISDFRDAALVAFHDLGLRKTLPPQGKLNAAQRFAYSGVIAMGAASVLTGLAVYKPKRLAWLTWTMGGYETARLLHFVLTIAYVAFVVMHVGQVARAGWNSFRSMVAGFEEEK